MSKTTKKWIIIVNLITFLRIIGSISIVFICKYLSNIKIGIIIAFFFLTDWIDGYLARRHNVCTFFGSIMDCISDKIFSIVSCIALCFINKYFIYSIIIELLIVLTNTLVFTQNGNIKSSKIGKAKTWVLSISIVVGFFLSKYSSNLIDILVVSPTLIIEFITLFDYVRNGSKIKFKVENKKPEYKSFNEIKFMLFDPEFYKENNDKQGLISNLYKSR